MITDLELRRHHRRARTAALTAFEDLGREHAAEDALTVFSGLTLVDVELVHALQHRRMAERRRRMLDAGISDDRIAAWLAAHAAAFAERLGVISARSVTA